MREREISDMDLSSIDSAIQSYQVVVQNAFRSLECPAGGGHVLIDLQDVSLLLPLALLVLDPLPKLSQLQHTQTHTKNDTVDRTW